MKHCVKWSPGKVTEEQISKNLKSLKPKNAANDFGLTTEHMKYASPNIIKLTNDIFKNRKLPDQFKFGALALGRKKKKPIKNPDNYSRITIASIIGKVVEKEMTTDTNPASQSKQDPLQYGFTERCSPDICSLMVMNAIAEAKDQKAQLYLLFMDSSKTVV